MTAIAQYKVQPIDVLMVSIVVLFLGMYLNRKVRVLQENFIPPAVTGGLICSAIVAIVFKTTDLRITFDMQIRDVLLLIFFSTVGLSAKLRTLIPGGKALAILVVIAAVFLVVQDATGVGLALLFDAHPAYGLFGGSVSFAGGHGTAIAWGKEAEAAGLESAKDIGIAFATFGLVAGGLIGGPVARWLIQKNGLKGPADQDIAVTERTAEGDGHAGDLFNILTAVLVLAICVAVGDFVNRFLFGKGVLVPGFLTSMFVGILITNIADASKFRIHAGAIEKFGEVSLNVFLAMSMMSIQLWSLAGAFGPIMAVLMVQMLVITLFAVAVVFRAMGRDYDASVISAGFVGLGLGATPVAIANMDVVTRRFGPSPKAFLVVPLVGAFFIDILNVITIKAFIGIITKWLV